MKLMCVEAGVSIDAFYSNYLEDNWIYIEAYQNRMRISWEQTRTLGFIVASYGNSDPKKMKKETPQSLLPLPWDKKKVRPSPQEIRKQWEAEQVWLAEMLEKQKLREQGKKADKK